MNIGSIKMMVIKIDILYELISLYNYSGVVINPFSHNLILDKSVILKLENTNKTNNDKVVQIGEPKEYPNELLSRLVRELKNKTSISEAYMLWMNKDEEQSYLMVVNSSSFEKDLIEIANISKEYWNDHQLLDIVDLNTNFGRNAISGFTPFYKNDNNK